MMQYYGISFEKMRFAFYNLTSKKMTEVELQIIPHIRPQPIKISETKITKIYEVYFDGKTHFFKRKVDLPVRYQLIKIDDTQATIQFSKFD